MGVRLRKDEVAFRCNLVTADGNCLVDYSAGHISTKEAKVLIDFLNRRLKRKGIKFYAGVSYRHIAVVNKSKGIFSECDLKSIKCNAPHDVVNMPLDKVFPGGKGNEYLRELMCESMELLADHEINEVRRQLGENPGNMIWLWGQGIMPDLPPFGIKGNIISAVDVVKGIGICAGLSVINVPGATGYFDTDYEAKARCAIDSLKENDFVLVHVEAPDEAGHTGNVGAKISSIEDFDKKIVGPVLSHIREMGDNRVCVLPDHGTPIDVKTHVYDMVPFAICGKLTLCLSACGFDEESAKETGTRISSGCELMKHFIISPNPSFPKRGMDKDFPL